MAFVEQIRSWWNKTFPYEQLHEITVLDGGDSHYCFRLNQNLVLKIYAPKHNLTYPQQEANFSNAINFLPHLQDSGITPKILGIFCQDPILKQDAILMEFIPGLSLSQIAYKTQGKEIRKLALQISTLLQKFHFKQIKLNQKYWTGSLIRSVYQELDTFESRDPKITAIGKKCRRFLQSFEPKIILEDFFLIHKDLHLENLIFGKDNLYIIDLDFCQLQPRWLEMQRLLHTCLAPHSLVHHNLSHYYSHGSLIQMLEAVVEFYPALCPKERLEEITLLAWYEIIGKLNAPSKDSKASTLVESGLYLYEMIIEKNLLVEIAF